MAEIDRSSDGFTLVEVVIAAGVLAIAMTAAVSGATAAAVAASRSRSDSMAAWLALDRLEQLRALAWGVDDGDTPTLVTDTVTDLSTSTPGTGGPGLAVSPGDALTRSAPGLADYLDGNGQWVGQGPVAPPAAVFVRRWRVLPVPFAHHALALEVVVSRLASQGGEVVPQPGEVRLVTIKTRKAS